jgi:hypothetical protein
MEFTIQLTTVLVFTFAIIGITLAIRLLSDIKDIRYATKLSRYLQRLGKRTIQRKVSIIIDVRKKANSILPLLDTINTNDYTKREVIIILRPNAGKNAEKKFKEYQQQSTIKNIRLVPAKANVPVIDVIRQYSTGVLVVLLAAEHRLPKNFFSSLSLDFTLQQPDAIVLNKHAAINKTLLSAFAVYSTMWQSTLNYSAKIMHTSLNIEPGVAYKRSAILRKRSSQINLMMTRSTASYVSLPAATNRSAVIRGRIADHGRMFRTLLGLIGTLGVVGILAYVWIFFQPQETSLLLCILIGAYALIYGGALWKIPAYSLYEKLNILLLLPVFILYDAALYIIGMLAPRLLVKPAPKKSNQ